MKTKSTSFFQELNTRRIVSALIIFGIAFIFAIQWGPGSRGCESPLGKNLHSAAATINGKEIPLRDFQRILANQAQMYRDRQIPLDSQRLSMQVLQQLELRELLAQEAERQGVLASDDELKQNILSNPDFQVDGKFSESRYHEITNDYYRRTVPEYEHNVRRELSIQKLLSLLNHSTMVSDDEVKAKYLKDADKAELTYVRFLPAMFNARIAAPKSKDLEAFKKQHAPDIAQYFKSHSTSYETPERVRARHILVRVDKEASAEKKAEAKKKIEQLRQEIEHGKDFAQVARESSDDPGSKTKGGDLGLNDRQSWVPEFSAVAFALKPGELSSPVETPFGFHLIRVDEKQPAQKKLLKDVENDIAKKLMIDAKAKDIARTEATKALAAIKSGKSLVTVYPPEKSGEPAALRFEAETKPEAVPTGEFPVGHAVIPRLGLAPELIKDVSGQKSAGPLEKVYPVGDGFVVAQVNVRHRPSNEEFAKEREKLSDEARKAKQIELQEAFISAIRKTAKVEENPAALTQNLSRGG